MWYARIDVYLIDGAFRDASVSIGRRGTSLNVVHRLGVTIVWRRLALCLRGSVSEIAWGSAARGWGSLVVRVEHVVVRLALRLAWLVALFAVDAIGFSLWRHLCLSRRRDKG